MRATAAMEHSCSCSRRRCCQLACWQIVSGGWAMGSAGSIPIHIDSPASRPSCHASSQDLLLFLRSAELIGPYSCWHTEDRVYTSVHCKRRPTTHSFCPASHTIARLWCPLISSPLVPIYQLASGAHLSTRLWCPLINSPLTPDPRFLSSLANILSPIAALGCRSAASAIISRKADRNSTASSKTRKAASPNQAAHPPPQRRCQGLMAKAPFLFQLCGCRHVLSSLGCFCPGLFSKPLKSRLGTSGPAGGQG